MTVATTKNARPATQRLTIPFRVSLIAFSLLALIVPLISPSGTVVMMASAIGIASLVSTGLVVLTGVGGMTSFGQAALMGIGAYTTAVLCLKFGWSPWLCLPAAILATGAASAAIGLFTIRLSGHFLPLGTIAWALSLYYLFGASEFLGGYGGLSGIPAPWIGSYSLEDPRMFYPVIWLIVAVAVVLTLNLFDSRVGRIIRSLRAGRTAVESFGANTQRLKLFVFVYAGVLAGTAGWLMAMFTRSVSASPFGLNAGIEYLLMAVIGGAGNVFGAIFGAGLVVVLRNYLQDLLPLLSPAAGNATIIVFGAILVLLLMKMPQGVWGAVVRRMPFRTVKSHPDIADVGLERQPMPPAGADLLRVKGLERRYGGLIAVNNVDFTIRAGAITGLIGPNGAGKSTTFNLTTGHVRPTAGKVFFLGEDVTGIAPRDVAGKRIARSFQHVKLVPDMNVLDNVAVGAHLRSRKGVFSGMLRLDRHEEARIRAEAMAALQRVGLADKAWVETGTLALGQMRIVEIARALCMDPVLLLLDEPAAGLRHHEKRALLTLLRELAAGGMTILIVEHDMGFVMELTDHLVVLNFGVRIADGTPAEVRSNPAVLAAYLGGGE